MNDTRQTPNLAQINPKTPALLPIYSRAKTSLRRLKRGIVAGLVGAACLGAANGASGAIISGTRIGFSNGSSSSQYGIGITQTLAGNGPADDTSAVFTYGGTTLGVFAIAADEGSDWYLATPGQLFSGAGSPAVSSILSGTDSHGNFSGSTASIPLGDFYLAVATGIGFTNGKPNRNVFGWIELHNTGTQLVPVANAVAYNDRGIMIGSTTSVPEPGTFFLALVALGILLAR